MATGMPLVPEVRSVVVAWTPSGSPRLQLAARLLQGPPLQERQPAKVVPGADFFGLQWQPGEQVAIVGHLAGAVRQQGADLGQLSLGQHLGGQPLCPLQLQEHRPQLSDITGGNLGPDTARDRTPGEAAPPCWFPKTAERAIPCSPGIAVSARGGNSEVPPRQPGGSGTSLPPATRRSVGRPPRDFLTAAVRQPGPVAKCTAGLGRAEKRQATVPKSAGQDHGRLLDPAHPPPGSAP